MTSVPAQMSSSGAHLEDQEAVTQLAAAMKDGNKDRVIEIVGMLIREDRMERVRSDLKERKKSIVLVDKNRAVDFQNSLMQPYRIGEPIMRLLKYGKLDCYVPSAVCFYLKRDGESFDAAHEMMRKRLPCYLKNIKCYTDPTPSKKYESAYINSKRTNIPVAFYCKTPVSLGEDRLGKDRLVDVNVLNVVALDSYIGRRYEKNEIEQILKLIGGAIKQKNDRLHEKILKEKRLEEKSSKETGGDAEPKREPRWWNIMMAAKNSSQSNEEKEKVIANKKLVIQLKDMKCGEDKTKKIKTVYYFTNRHLLKTNEENEKRATLIKTAADNNELFNPEIHEGFFDTERFDITRRQEPIAFKVNAYMGAWNTLSADADRNELLREALFVFEWNGASAMGHGVPDENFSLDPQIQFFNSIGRHSAIAFLAMSIRQPYVGVPP